MFVLQKEMVMCLARNCRGKEESPLGRYRIRKESSCIRKALMSNKSNRIRRGKGLSIRYIRMTCIHVWDKQE